MAKEIFFLWPLLFIMRPVNALLIFLVLTHHLCISQGSEKLISKTFANINYATDTDKRYKVDYIWKQKPLLTDKEFSSSVALYVDRTILNEDSLASFVLFFNLGFQYFFNNNFCRSGTKNDISCFQKDTFNYLTNYDLIAESVQLFPSLIKYPSMRLNLEKIENYSIKEDSTYSRPSVTIIYSEPLTGGAYDSIFIHVDKESNQIVKFRRSIYDSEVGDLEYKIFDSIVYTKLDYGMLEEIKDSLLNGKVKTLYDPYTEINKTLSDTLIELPELNAQDAKGNLFNIDSILSDYLLLDFTYTSCYFCLKSIPLLNEVHKTISSKKLTVVAIDPVDFERKQYSDSLFKKRGVEYPIYYEKSKDIKKKISVFPTLYLIDVKRKVILRSYVGFTNEMHSAVLKDIEVYIK